MLIMETAEFKSLLREALKEILPELIAKQKDKMYTADEAADFLRISKKTLKRWTVDGRVRCSKPGYKALYTEDDLKALVLNKRSG